MEIAIINTGLEFDILEKTSSEKQLKEEIDNFCHEFQSEINQNGFVKATISLVAGYIFRRFFYPSHYLKDFSFFNLYDENKKKEENKKIKLFTLLLLFTCTKGMNFNDKEKDNNKLEEAELIYEDLIKLLLINTNKRSYYHWIDVEKNLKKVIQNYEKSVDSNYSYVYYQLGKLYLQGKGVEQDLIKGRKYLEYSPQLNNLEALFTLGDINETGNINFKSNSLFKQMQRKQIWISYILFFWL